MGGKIAGIVERPACIGLFGDANEFENGEIGQEIGSNCADGEKGLLGVVQLQDIVAPETICNR
ncbi:MAG: hypothetical protein WDN03_08030 [Rhizomicrobium sp.]